MISTGFEPPYVTAIACRTQMAMKMGRQLRAPRAREVGGVSPAASCASRGERSRSSSIRFEASAFDSVSSNSSPVSRHSVSRSDRCASVIGSSPVFHSSGSR